MLDTHTFHIPVMGTGYTADTPIRVAHLGISSVISLVDDLLLERLRSHYSKLYNISFEPISRSDDDGRAKRITAYLDMVSDIVHKRMEDVRKQSIFEKSEKRRYFELLPNSSSLKQRFLSILSMPPSSDRDRMDKDLTADMKPGSIDVNIMVKLDKPNRNRSGNFLPDEFSDAKAALRGFALSKLESAIVFSAGINQSLYSYTSQFRDFYRDCNGKLKKRIIVKISDFRSALTQGKFLAKKGLEVSEFRIESGLNCGGHAFASGCQILPTILKSFKEKRQDLSNQLHGMVKTAYEKLGFEYPEEPQHAKVTVQGGIGNSGENQRMMDYYHMDGTGWGSPFLLVPEACPVDAQLRQRLAEAKSDDLELGNNSPMGVPFNTLKNSPAHINAQERIAMGKPGSGCPKGYVKIRHDYGEELCAASNKFQTKRLEEIEASDMSETDKAKARKAALEPLCICHQLGNSALIELGLARYKGAPQSICPGPNIAWYNGIYSLDQMIDHIYGRIDKNLESHERPHMFASEAMMNMNYLEAELSKSNTAKEAKALLKFHTNLAEGIEDCGVVAESTPYQSENLNSLKEFVQKAKLHLDEIKQSIQEKIEILTNNLEHTVKS